MSAYPTSPQSFTQIFYRSVRNLFPVFKHTLFFIFCIVLVKDLYVYLGGMPANKTISSIIILAMILVIIYLWCAMLFSAHGVLNGKSARFAEALFHFNNNIVQVMLSFILYILGAVAIFLLLHLVTIIADQIWGATNWFHGYVYNLITGLLVLYWLVLMMMAPLTVLLEGAPALLSFKLSAALVVKRFWAVFGLVVFFLAIYILVSPDTIHGHFITRYYMNAPFDFLVFSVMLPTLANMTLLMWHDLKLRQAHSPEL